MRKISVALELSSKPSKAYNNLYNIMIRLTQERKHRRYSSDFYIDAKHWNTEDKKVMGGKRGNPQAHFINDSLSVRISALRNWLSRQYLDGIEVSQQEAIDFLNGVKARLKEEKQEKEDRSFTDYSQNYFKRTAYSSGHTYITYENNHKVFHQFVKGLLGREWLGFPECDKNLLLAYKNYLQQKGLAPSTINNYLSYVKQVLRDAAENGYEKEIDSSALLKVKMLKREQSAKARLNEAELEKMLAVRLAWGTMMRRDRDAFMASYYLFGARITDIMLMRKKHYQNAFSYVMSKTKKQMRIGIHARLESLLEPYLRELKEEDEFIFPYLRKGNFDALSKVEQAKLLRKQLVHANYNLKKIAELAGVKKKISMHISRHTFAEDYLKKTNDFKKASNALGHSSYSITDAYYRNQGILGMEQDAKDFYEED